MKKTYDVIVIGAGAAGLFAAYCAAGYGMSVCVLDHSEKPGAKLLVTGNGRCNFTNREMDASRYFCEDPDFVNQALGQFDTSRTLAFFRKEFGIFSQERDGYVYPRSNQARAVRDALIDGCKRRGVILRTGVAVTGIEPVDRQLIRVTTKDGIFFGESVILATGGKSYPKTGSDGSGFAYARRLSHTVTEPFPSLVPLITEKSEPLLALSGVRTRAKISLTIRERKDFFASDTGELQITGYGISGIPVFQVSHYAGEALLKKMHVFAHLDFLPEFSDEEVHALIASILKSGDCKDSPIKNSHQAGDMTKNSFQKTASAKNRESQDSLYRALCGLFPDKLANLLMKTAGSNPDRLFSRIKDYTIPILSTKDYSMAQVTAGGVSISEVDPQTMQSKICPGVFFAGEMLDVDGQCGGYNLQWAWTSAWIAAQGVMLRNRS